MKKTVFVLTAAPLLGLGACRKEFMLGAEKKSTLSSLELTYKQPTMTATSNLYPVRLTLTEVKDSRCPEDLQCFWAGRVEVAVVLTDSDAITQTIHLGTTAKSPATDSVEVTLNKRDYWVRLLAVSPYPSHATQNQPKVAKLRLRLRKP
jgi:hypothetical protein